MLIWKRSSLAGALVLLCACGEPESPAIPGLEIEEWEAHSIASDARFVDMRDMTLIDHSLWVLDGAPPFLTRISLETGKAIHFGQEGEGPGEFLAPWAIQPNTDSSGILVWDFRAYRVTEFDLDGTYQGSTTMSQTGRILARSDFRKVSYADPFRVRSTPEGYLAGLFDRRLDHTADFCLGAIRLSGPSLDPGQLVVNMGALMVPGVESMTEWAPVPFWDACAGYLTVWNPASREVTWIGPNRSRHAQVRFDLPSGELQTEDIERYLEQMARLELGPEYHNHEIDFSTMARQVQDRFSANRPLVTDLRCQDADAVWLRLFSTRDDPLGRAPEWINVGRAGPSHHIRTPSGFSPLVFTSEGHFGPLELVEGDQAIARLTPPATRFSDPG